MEYIKSLTKLIARSQYGRWFKDNSRFWHVREESRTYKMVVWKEGNALKIFCDENNLHLVRLLYLGKGFITPSLPQPDHWWACTNIDWINEVNCSNLWLCRDPTKMWGTPGTIYAWLGHIVFQFKSNEMHISADIYGLKWVASNDKILPHIIFVTFDHLYGRKTELRHVY